MSLAELTAAPCPCGYKNCSSGNILPITYGQGVMSMEEAREITRRCNEFPKLVEAVRKIHRAIENREYSMAKEFCVEALLGKL